MSLEFFGSSDAKIVINMAPMEDAFALRSAIHANLKLPKIDFKTLKGEGSFTEKLKAMDAETFIDSIISSVLAIDSNKEVNEALMRCLERCTYNGQKITARTFDQESARIDYYEIFAACFRVNIIPFYKGLLSQWNTVLKKIAENSPLSK